ncbi:hypothetical protein EVAR_38399_1 [Eumeta japonica]|uniref:Uncharacterized protein n=1 Tax=Eumeta variegata TaxID=151549 RepID=A0A4C1YLW9_EUMVA|nr:hypothetical protein EVAR_38399_1 [Eumeta japonica]
MQPKDCQTTKIEPFAGTLFGGIPLHYSKTMHYFNVNVKNHVYCMASLVVECWIFKHSKIQCGFAPMAAVQLIVNAKLARHAQCLNWNPFLLSVGRHISEKILVWCVSVTHKLTKIWNGFAPNSDRECGINSDILHRCGATPN